MLDFAPLARAFRDFDLAFTGRMPGYFGVDTVYHDQQHTLDVTLAMARLHGRLRAHACLFTRYGAWSRARRRRLLLALFHDIGYLREHGEEARNGAEFTRNHVTRGARFMDRYLPTIGFGHWTHITREVMHFTGYERTFEQIEKVITDPRDIKLGHLLGTADMIAQMADRCYLEKCRDRLYPEFVLGGRRRAAGRRRRGVKYASGLDLLRQTPAFVEETRRKRLDTAFNQAYRYLEPMFGGRNPYIEAIDAAWATCARSCAARAGGCCAATRRSSPPSRTRITNVRGLMVGYFRKAWTPE